MFRIGICDGSQNNRHSLIKISDKYLGACGISYEYAEFATREELLTYCRNNRENPIHLLFLDIETLKQNEMEEKRDELQNQNVQGIFSVFSLVNKMPDEPGLEVLAFLKKPVERLELEHCFNAALKDLYGNHIVSYEGMKGTDCIEIESIRYIKADKDYTYMYVVGSSEPIWTKYRLKRWENILMGKPFIKVQRSYIVNLKHIVKIKNGVFVSGEESPIRLGRKYRDIARNVYREYVEKTD